MKSSASLLLDTHIWFRLQVTPKVLRPSTFAAIEEAALRDAVYVSVFSVWELAMLEQHGKLELDGGVSSWTRRALAVPGLSLLPLSAETAILSAQLPAPMHKDPADRILMATALIEQLTLVTSDKALLAFSKTTKLAHLRG